MPSFESVCFVVPTQFWEKNDGAKILISNELLAFPARRKYVFLTKYIRLSSQQKKQIATSYGLEYFECGLPFLVTLKKILANILYKLHVPLPYGLMKPVRYSFFARRKFHNFMRKNAIQVLRCDYIWYADLCRDVLLDDKVVHIIKTHDIQSTFFQTQKEKTGRTKWFVRPKDEIAILNQFDIVLGVSKEDCLYFEQCDLKGKVMYLPTVYEPMDVPAREHSDGFKVGFVGGDAEFNAAAVNWFLDNVVPSLSQEISFCVFGGVCKAIAERKDEHLICYGPFKDPAEVYSKCDLMVNPTFQSGGIKTKNIEALHYGVPVLTTSIGARGFDEGVGDVIFVGDEPDFYIRTINDANAGKFALPSAERCCTYVQKNFGTHLLDEYHEAVWDLLQKRL